MSNNYNSPTNQMARLREAGINPRLVFGSSGATGGISTAPKSGSPSSYKYNVPDFSQKKPLQLPDGIGGYLDMEMKRAQIDAIEKQTALTQQKEANEAVENAIKVAEADNAPGYFKSRSSKLHFDKIQSLQKTELGKYSSQVAMEKLEQTKHETSKRALDVKLSSERVIGERIKNEYAGKGISSENLKMLYRQLKQSGMNDESIATTLLIAGAAGYALKNILPAGIIGKSLSKLKIGALTPSTDKSRKAPVEKPDRDKWYDVKEW